MGSVYSYLWEHPKSYYKYIPSDTISKTKLYYLKCLEVKKLFNQLTPSGKLWKEMIEEYRKVYEEESEDYDPDYITDVLDPKPDTEKLEEHNSMVFVWINVESYQLIGISLLAYKQHLIHSFMITEKYRRQGYGSHFLAYIIQKCFSIYPLAIKLKVELLRWNYQSINFLQKNGFKEEYDSINHKYKAEEDDILMYQLDLSRITLPTLLPKISFQNY